MKTVYVGLSGGVDSSVAVVLLKERGFRVVGVYMQNWTRSIGGVDCPWKQDLADAKAVAAQLDIEFKVFDFQTQYKARVVDYMVDEYRSGRTPNPDVMCNQEIKFKLFLETALADGADLIGTGHHARVQDSQLLAGRDPNKDQSYFLYRVSRLALAKTLMPVGDFTKAEIRTKAAELGLVTAQKPDSQGICFVGEVGIKEFLQQFVQTAPGSVRLMRDGSEVGRHDGAIFYTIGQRHGLGIGGGRPYYVMAKDMVQNIIYVTDEVADLHEGTERIWLESPHWIEQPPQPGQTYRVRTRHLGELSDCTVDVSGQETVIQLAVPTRTISPGQSAVIYDGERVVGGGVMARAARIGQPA